MESPSVVYGPLMLSSPEAEPLHYNEQEIMDFGSVNKECSDSTFRTPIWIH